MNNVIEGKLIKSATVSNEFDLIVCDYDYKCDEPWISIACNSFPEDNKLTDGPNETSIQFYPECDIDWSYDSGHYDTETAGGLSPGYYGRGWSNEINNCGSGDYDFLDADTPITKEDFMKINELTEEQLVKFVKQASKLAASDYEGWCEDNAEPDW